MNEDLEIVDTYIDDGFSGLNFNRLSFRRMINDIAPFYAIIITNQKNLNSTISRVDNKQKENKTSLE